MFAASNCQRNPCVALANSISDSNADPRNMGKKIAMCIKRPVAPQPQSTVPPRPYGDRFVDFFEDKWIGESEDGGEVST